MSWKWKAALFAATIVIAMALLVRNFEQPLTPYEQAFVGVWFDTHPGKSTTRLRLGTDRVVYRSSVCGTHRIGRWSAVENEFVLKVRMDEPFVRYYSLEDRFHCLRGGNLTSAIKGGPISIQHYTVESKSSVPIALKWPHDPNVISSGGGHAIISDASIYSRSIAEAKQFDREFEQEMNEVLARLIEVMNDFEFEKTNR